jgi:hypothetical protein
MPAPARAGKDRAVLTAETRPRPADLTTTDSPSAPSAPSAADPVSILSTTATARSLRLVARSGVLLGLGAALAAVILGLS